MDLLFASLDLDTFAEQDSHFLGAVMEAIDRELERLEYIRGHAEMVLDKRMRDAGATAIPDETLIIERKMGSPTYDGTVLSGLRELIPPEVLAGVYTPEHKETHLIKERWDGVKLRGLRKYGDEVCLIIDQGTIRPMRGIAVRRKE
jgi:hypothetical protein